MKSSLLLDTAPDAGLRLQPSQSHQDNVGQAEGDSVHSMFYPPGRGKTTMTELFSAVIPSIL